GEKIIREIIGTPSSPFTVMGFVDDDISIQGASLHGFKVLGTVKDLPNITIKYDEILITAPSATGDQMRKIVKVSKSTGKPFKTVPSLIELIDKDMSLANIRNVSYSDLLGRKEVKLDMNSIKEMLNGKRVLITGAGGSIGSELVTQCLTFSPSEIICYDNNEEKIFDISVRANKHETPTIIKPVLGSVLNKNELAKVFNETKPQIILHAAAYKHVPIQEDHPWNAVNTNVQGTLNMVEMADNNNAEKFVLVSTDKAVNPVNVMGATKRIAEKIIQSINLSSKTQFMAVRFGNVLGSSGSAIPTFQKQINEGGPVTITHPEMTRFFMSIQEASQLILQSAAIGRDGEIFLLEMGKSIKIDQMARDLIRLSGLEPEDDIPIVYTGLRPGEKLYEELQTQDENLIVTEHKKIMILKNENHKVSWEEFKVMVQECINIAQTLDIDKIQLSLKNLVPYYQPRPFASKVPSKQQDSFPIRWEA
ncbi:MAG: polysaccharide biosynthesis protein, partial [Candidatus Marinimicrobia bacterium]|nr:polysaccharide biosynthesis protein [Candidatus Neomarinimicrobiota bacterium]